MAFSIADLLAYFSQAADGQRMAPDVPSAGILNQVGAGRGVVNPPLVSPNAARPRGVLAQPPAPAVTAPPLPAPIDVATASVDRLPPDTSSDNIDAGGGQNFAQMAPVSDAVVTPVPQQPGIMSRLFDDSKTGVSPIEHLIRGFTAAGTADPAKTMMQFASQDAETAKVREAQKARMMPKIVGQAGPNGAIQLVQMPDGSIVPKTIDQVMEMNKALKLADFDYDVRKAILVEEAKDRLKSGAESRKAERESAPERVQAGLNVQELTSIADALEKTDTASGPVIGLLPKSIRDRVFPDGASLQDRAERVIQGGLRATLGGQFTQAEGDRFLARAYNPNLSEQQNAANLRTIAREIAAMQLDKDAAQTYFKQNGTLEGFVPKGVDGGVAAPRSKADFDAIPSGTRFRAPDNTIRVKP